MDSNGDNSERMVNGDKKAFGGSSSIRFGDGSNEISQPLQKPAVSFDQTSNRNHNTKNPPIQRISRLKSRVFLPRLIPRNFPFDQSSNGVQIFNEHKHVIWGLLRRDWFHAMLRIPGWLSLLLIVSVWVAMIFVFAFIYMAIDSSTHNLKKNCGLGEPGEPIKFPSAYAFSLETCTTVGYGLPGPANGFFNDDCSGLQFAITVQMIWSMLSNAFIVSFFFALLSKSDARSIQIIFSKKLCVNVVDGKVCTSVRCYDLDSSYPLVECHARMYLIDHKLKFHPLRLLEPNDDLGGVLYPSAPTNIIHHIDHHSPLSPRRMPLIESDNGLALRSVDSATANREEIICPVCGEGYGTYERLRKHIKYARIVEEQDGYPTEGSHLGYEMPDTSPTTLEEVQRYIEHMLSEIVVVVEAIDPQLSGTFQALQSYKYDDIEFGADFERCMYSENNKFKVDLFKFHDIVYDDSMYSSRDLKFEDGRCKICPIESKSESESI